MGVAVPRNMSPTGIICALQAGQNFPTGKAVWKIAERMDFPAIIWIWKLPGIFKIFLALSQPGIYPENLLEKPWIISEKT